MDLAFLAPIVQSLAQKYPWVLSLLMIIGISRLALKPVFAVAMRYMELEPNPEKRAKVEKLLASRAWKTFAFAVDYIFSVKLPYTQGSLGERVQNAVIADKGNVPEIEPPKPAAGL
ncbi:MAG: hypothetical protein E6Q97_34040 [Desulfurellales bacterium]|jgi:hypothetical protein|nr:MAG: hypothetical protein E6Q97_34040 [Desulfurellales bacterium]